eukprot:g25781.t1
MIAAISTIISYTRNYITSMLYPRTGGRAAVSYRRHVLKKLCKAGTTHPVGPYIMPVDVCPACGENLVFVRSCRQCGYRFPPEVVEISSPRILRRTGPRGPPAGLDGAELAEKEIAA